jgi:hypothetical protein
MAKITYKPAGGFRLSKQDATAIGRALEDLAAQSGVKSGEV